MLVAQNIELFTLALSGITIILIPDKGPKYRTPGNPKYEIHKSPPPYLTTWIRHCNIWEIFHGVRTGENLKQMENASLSQGDGGPFRESPLGTLSALGYIQYSLPTK